MRNLRTTWLTIGRSGNTIDGRKIDAADIQAMADTYQTDTYTALIWPEHARYINLGKVLELRAVGNSEGGKDLQAIISPNEFYVMTQGMDQRLYTSMEITADFRGTGKAYLTGLGATDSPASAGTSEVRFSRQEPGTLTAPAVEIQMQTQRPGILERLFGTQQPQEEDEMDKEALKALADEMKAIRKDFDEFKTAGKPPATPPAAETPPTGPTAEEFAALKAQVEAFAAKPPADPADALAGLEEKLGALESRLTEALNSPHPNGSKPPEQRGPAGEVLAEF